MRITEFLRNVYPTGRDWQQDELQNMDLTMQQADQMLNRADRIMNQQWQGVRHWESIERATVPEGVISATELQLAQERRYAPPAKPAVPRCAHCRGTRDDKERTCPGCGSREKVG